MEKWIDGLLADISPPEKPKFRSPLVLVHGLWSGSWCWRLWATHFSNLGWECWAVNFRGRFEKNAYDVLRQVSAQDCLEDLKRVIRSVPFPPVLIGHNLGGLIALKAAQEGRVSALILLSSLPPGRMEVSTSRTLKLLRLKYLPLIFLHRPFRLQDKDFRRNWLASVPEGRQPDVLKRMVPESSHLVDDFFSGRVQVEPGGARTPVLVVGGDQDRVVSAASMREIAQSLGSDILEYPGHGHWMMEEDEGERIVRDIHRWMVQKLGEKILLDEISGHGENAERE
jgi:pimeloyl-ACP methyl ester carboxylesterase